MRRKVALLLACIWMLTPIYGSSLKNKQNELNQTESNISQAKKDLEANKKAQEAIEAEMEAVDQKMIKIEATITDLERQLEAKQVELAQSEVELNQAIAQKDVQYNETKGRMVQMYKNQHVGYLQVVFSSSSFWEAINRIEYIRRISKQDQKLLEEYKAQVELVEAKKQSIEAERVALQTLKKDAEAQKAELEAARANKDSKLDELASKAGMLREDIENMENIAEELTTSIKKLTQQAQAAANKSSASSGTSSSVSSKYTGGKFSWPVPGYYYISSEYGGRTSPISGKYEFHSGIDIPASYGNNVVAAADGTVITSGWVRGYGNTIMISHGGGLVTLYGHNSSLSVSNGQTVKKGQVVAKIGSTGYSTGNHCHFEVRLNGESTSPWNYLSK